MLYKGDRVGVSELYTKAFNVRSPLNGTVWGMGVSPGTVRVQWDGKTSRETLHVSFLRRIPKVPEKAEVE